MLPYKDRYHVIVEFYHESGEMRVKPLLFESNNYIDIVTFCQDCREDRSIEYIRVNDRKYDVLFSCEQFIDRVTTSMTDV